jgi:hypothetical protein
MRNGTLAAVAGSTHPGANWVLSRSQFPNATMDRTARQTGRRRCRPDAAKAMSLRLIRREQPPAALVKERLGLTIAATHFVDINHSVRLAFHRRAALRKIWILFLCSCGHPDSLISRQALIPHFKHMAARGEP